MVALLCASLLAAGVLSLVGHAAWLCRQQRARVAAQGIAATTAGLVARALGEAGAGLEGATAVRWHGASVPVIDVGAAAAGVIAATGPAVEVEPWDTWGGSAGFTEPELTGRRFVYRAATFRPPGARRHRMGVTRDDRVVGLGLPDATPGAEGTPLEVLPAGSVIEAEIVEGGGRVVVDWDDPPPAEVRALARVRRRELGLRPFEGAWQLRRRDDDGRWQPMIDSVGELTIDLEPPFAVVTARALMPSGATAIARRRVALRSPS
jgi:hypothetical protein